MSLSRTTKISLRVRWHLWLRAVAMLVLLYAVGYFVLMDRHRPTSAFRNANDYFESSFRWAAKQRASKDNTGPETNFPDVTIWNIIYNPLDKIFFRLYPRPTSEIEMLRALGYYK